MANSLFFTDEGLITSLPNGSSFKMTESCSKRLAFEGKDRIIYFIFGSECYAAISAVLDKNYVNATAMMCIYSLSTNADPSCMLKDDVYGLLQNIMRTFRQSISNLSLSALLSYMKAIFVIILCLTSHDPTFADGSSLKTIAQQLYGIIMIRAKSEAANAIFYYQLARAFAVYILTYYYFQRECIANPKTTFQMYLTFVATLFLGIYDASQGPIDNISYLFVWKSARRIQEENAQLSINLESKMFNFDNTVERLYHFFTITCPEMTKEHIIYKNSIYFESGKSTLSGGGAVRTRGEVSFRMRNLYYLMGDAEICLAYLNRLNCQVLNVEIEYCLIYFFAVLSHLYKYGGMECVNYYLNCISNTIFRSYILELFCKKGHLVLPKTIAEKMCYFKLVEIQMRKVEIRTETIVIPTIDDIDNELAGFQDFLDDNSFLQTASQLDAERLKIESKSKATLEAYQEASGTLDELILKAKSELEILRAEEISIMKRIDSVAHDMQLLAQRMDSTKLTTKTVQIEEKERMQRQLESEVLKYNNEKNLALEKIRQLQAEISNMQKDILNAKRQTNELKTETHKINEDHFKRELATKQIVLNNLTNEKNMLKQRAEQKQQELDKERGLLRKMEMELEELMTRAETDTKDMGKLRVQYEKLKADLEMKREKIRMTEKRMLDAKVKTESDLVNARALLSETKNAYEVALSKHRTGCGSCGLGACCCAAAEIKINAISISGIEAAKKENNKDLIPTDIKKDVKVHDPDAFCVLLGDILVRQTKSTPRILSVRKTGLHSDLSTNEIVAFIEGLDLTYLSSLKMAILLLCCIPKDMRNSHIEKFMQKIVTMYGDAKGIMRSLSMLLCLDMSLLFLPDLDIRIDVLAILLCTLKMDISSVSFPPLDSGLSHTFKCYLIPSERKLLTKNEPWMVLVTRSCSSSMTTTVLSHDDLIQALYEQLSMANDYAMSPVNFLEILNNISWLLKGLVSYNDFGCPDWLKVEHFLNKYSSVFVKVIGACNKLLKSCEPDSSTELCNLGIEEILFSFVAFMKCPDQVEAQMSVQQAIQNTLFLGSSLWKRENDKQILFDSSSDGMSNQVIFDVNATTFYLNKCQGADFKFDLVTSGTCGLKMSIKSEGSGDAFEVCQDDSLMMDFILAVGLNIGTSTLLTGMNLAAAFVLLTAAYLSSPRGSPDFIESVILALNAAAGRNAQIEQVKYATNPYCQIMESLGYAMNVLRYLFSQRLNANTIFQQSLAALMARITSLYASITVTFTDNQACETLLRYSSQVLENIYLPVGMSTILFSQLGMVCSHDHPHYMRVRMTNESGRGVSLPVFEQISRSHYNKQILVSEEIIQCIQKCYIVWLEKIKNQDPTDEASVALFFTALIKCASRFNIISDIQNLVRYLEEAKLTNEYRVLKPVVTREELTLTFGMWAMLHKRTSF